MDLNDNNYTYANLSLLQIKRMLQNTLSPNVYTDAELINMGLDLLRILIEISSGIDGEQREWDLFFNAQKNEKSLLFFLHELYMKSIVKNELLNEILKSTKTEDLEILIKDFKR